MSEPIIERCLINMKPGDGQIYVDLFPKFREMLMGTPGAISTRLLRQVDKPDNFMVSMEFESQAAKELFLAHPDLKDWAAKFFSYVESETIHYYGEAG